MHANDKKFYRYLLKRKIRRESHALIKAVVRLFQIGLVIMIFGCGKTPEKANAELKCYSGGDVVFQIQTRAINISQVDGATWKVVTSDGIKTITGDCIYSNL